jgi:Matrixin
VAALVAASILRGVAAALLLLAAAAGATASEPVEGSRTAPPAPPSAASLPRWGGFDGAPARFARPRGGSASVRRQDGRAVVLLRRPSGEPFARADAGPRGVDTVRYYDRAGHLRLVITAVRTLAAAGTVKRANSRCGTDQRRDAGYRWSGPIAWRFVAASTPSGLDVARTEGALRSARTEWELNRNHCGIPDRSAVDFQYRGRTGTGLGRNGLNTIGFGETDTLGGACVRTIACTITWTSGPGAIESDTRLDDDRRWGNVGQAGRFDVWSIAAHETGHTLGLEHVPSNDNVMECCARVGETSDRLLGRGDANANNARY